MFGCPACARVYPEVVGAPTQVCPHCGHEAPSTPAEGLARGAPAPDPVGALEHAWRVVRRDHVKLLLIWLPATLAELAVAFTLRAYERSAGIPADASLLTTGESMQLLGVALPLQILVFTLRLALWTFIAARALDRPAPLATLAGPALAAGFVLTLTYFAGLLLALVGFFVFLHWFLYVPARIALGASGVGSAFEASRRFSRERRPYGFTALVSLVGATLFVLVLLAGSLDGTMGVLAAAALGWVTGPIVPLLAASFVAVSMGAGPEDARAPELSRDATRCPQCGTLIPYAPSTSPIQLVCPSCGHAARLL